MISICIPIYNHYAYPLVRRLARQIASADAEKYEIVCIDDHSSGYYVNQNKGIAELARIHKVKLVTAEEYQFFKSWKNSLIRELAPCMDGANPKEISRATRYRVKTGEVREILEFLQEAGYLTQDAQGNYRQADRSLRMGSEARNSASKTVQKAIAHDLQVQMAELATDALKNDPAQGRNITGLTLGITREAYGQIVEELAECRRRIVAIATESARTEEVYRLNMQLFPLSDMHNEGFIQDSPSSKGVKK